MPPTAEKQNVVVVGGGAAGTLICRRLASKLNMAKCNLVLITAAPFYTHLPACIRAMVDSATATGAQIPYETLLRGRGGTRRCRVVVGEVVAIEEDEDNDVYDEKEKGEGGVWRRRRKERGGRVVVEGTEGEDRVRYEVLVLATGCRWDGLLTVPGTREGVEVWLREWRERFRKAEDVVIVGGGATGLEFAGEIRDLSQTKRITIVHDQPLLLNDAYPDSFRKAVAKNIRRRDVELVLNDSIHDLEISEGRTIQTTNGRILVADLVLPCWGPRPNTEFIATLGPEAVVSTGHVKVLPTLQLSGHPRIFAAGDIIDWDEQKQAEKYGAHVDVVVKNVIDVLKHKQPNALYRGCYETIVIANGKGGGSTYYSFWGPNLRFGDLVSSIAQSKLRSKGPKI